MNSKINIAFIQTNLIWEKPSENRRLFTEKIESISFSSDVIVLPEMFTTGFSMHPAKHAETMDGKTVCWMKKISKEKQVALMGSLMIKEDEKYFNRLIFTHPNGMVDWYDKRHLFSYGGEDKMYSVGNKILIVDYKGWKICPMICYDLRFPVWSRNSNNYDVLIYVANWPKPRINAWDILLKARSIENMCYTVGVNRIGIDGNKLEYVGHSQAIDVLGNYMISSEEKEGVFEVELDKKILIKTREKFRFLNDKDSFSIEK